MSHSPVGESVLDAEQIRQGVDCVASALNERFDRQGRLDDEAVVAITVVPGGILFTGDLVKQLTFDLCMDFISCPHTPGNRNNTSNIVYHKNVAIEGKHVILIDDAVESGGTMKRLVEFIKNEYAPLSVSVATLFVKPGRVSIDADQYFAYEMDNDDLLVGYGLPWQDKYRNLPCVSKLNK